MPQGAHAHAAPTPPAVEADRLSVRIRRAPILHELSFTVPAGRVSSGPRVGVAGAGGSEDYAWRFWLTGDPTVSKYKAAKPRNRNTAGAPPGFHRR